MEVLIARSGVFNSITLNDAHPYLIAMWKALQGGWQPPREISEKEYKRIKAHMDDDPALAGFAGFCCAFSGKWFGSYARDNTGRRDNYADTGRRAVLRDIRDLRQARFICGDYRDVEIPREAVIYCDPPYKGTAGYSGAGRFDSSEFWDYAAQLADSGCAVYVSEMQAPDGWVSVLDIEKRRTISNYTGRQGIAIERLYVREGQGLTDELYKQITLI